MSGGLRPAGPPYTLARVACSRQRGLDLLLLDVGVRPDLLRVVMLFEEFHQLDHLLRGLAFELDVVLGEHRDLRGRRLDAEPLYRLVHRGERLGGGDNLPVVLVVFHVVGPGVDRRREQLLFIRLALLDDDVAFLLEHPGDAVGLTEVAAVLREGVPHFADGAVLVIGEHLDHDRDAPGAIPLVGDFLVRDARELPRAALDRALDVVGRHVRRLGFRHDRAQPRVLVDVAAAVARRDGQFLDDAREDLAALGVSRALLVLDGVPFGMAGHGETPRKLRELRRKMTIYPTMRSRVHSISWRPPRRGRSFRLKPEATVFKATRAPSRWRLPSGGRFFRLKPEATGD